MNDRQNPTAPNDNANTSTKAQCCGPSCCDSTEEMTAKADTKPNVTKSIQDAYGRTATAGLSSRHAGVHAVAEAFGYSAEELAAIPAEANMGLSCGNPIAMANLNAGETVVDLGSGGGLDVFLAADKVGPTGKAIGIDMTPAMIDLANRNAQRGPGGKPYANVEFKLGSIDQIPLPDASVDVIISNCVINLAPDKQVVFREMFRVLKPGGRVAVSDIALKAALPQELADNIAAMVGCIAGAIPIGAFDAGLQLAGFEHVAVIDAGTDLTAYAKVEGQAACCAPPEAPNNAAEKSAAVGLTIGTSCCNSTDTSAATQTADEQPALHRDLSELFEKYDVNAYAASVKVFAIKAANGD